MAEIPKEDLPKTESEWKEKLSAEEFRIARQKGTERAFSGKYWNEKSDGVYRCVCCKAPLFRSEHKFDSGTGWPSFYQEAEKDRVKENTDHTHGMTRTEVVCAKCEAHLGHVFEDGPKPTGMRYCINSASLVLDKKEGDSKKKE